MKTLDHDTFHSLEIDALYDELDGPGSSAVRDHAASCESCAARFERLRRARQRGLSVLAEAVPDKFESRIMAAVDAALAKRAKAAPVAVAGGAGAGAKVIPFFARPSFAVAATMILVLGAAAILSQMGMAKKAAPMASSESAPAAVAASAFAPDLAATTIAPATGALALGERENAGAATQGAGAPAEVVAQAAPAPRAPSQKPAMLAAAEPPADEKPAKAAPMGRAGPATDPAFAAARALYDAGRYAEALPRFEALKANNPEADLYAARCIQKTRGCTAAAPRFDAAARSNSGTELGSRARLEAGTCYQQIGQAQAARTRYQATKDEGILSTEAASDLDALDQEAARARPPAPAAAATSTASPGTPAAGKPASPKAPPPVQVDPLDQTRH